MKDVRITLTGFMGVGKSSVARHLSSLLEIERVDLDTFIEESEGRSIAEIIDTDGEAAYREIESRCLAQIVSDASVRIISLGGGAWTVPANRELIQKHGITSIWLESTFEHCWYNIRASKKERPLARSKGKARRLFEERQGVYCLADSHIIIKPEFTSYDIAKQIAEQIFG
jgi:shikimate kinase